MLIWLLIACGPEPTATLFADVTDQSGQYISNPTITVYNAIGELFNTVEGNDRGKFSTALPVEDTFYLVISAPDFETHSFTGQSGIGEISPESGALWLRTVEAADAVRAQFSDCASTSGSFVDGQARIYINGLEDLPITITTATVKVIGSDGLDYEGCYVPEIDSETGEEIPSEATGENGEFGIFGLSPGVQTIHLTPNIPDTVVNLPNEAYTYQIYVPENGSVPKYPILVPMPTE